MSETHEKLWAKSADKKRFEEEGEKLFVHSLNVAENARKICQRLPFSPAVREELERVLVQAGAFHDLGKAATGFQAMLRKDRKTLREEGGWGHRHETLSTALARVISPELEPCVLFAILTHHRNIPEENAVGSSGEKCLPPLELPPRFGGLSGETWRQMLSEMRENWESFADLLDRLSREIKVDFQPVSPDDSFLDLGLNNFWLKRSRQREEISNEEKWQASLLRGLLITSDHIASSVDPLTGKHPEILDVPPLSNFEKIIKEKELRGAPILPFQEKAGRTDGSAILKAPTGSGKTLAALLWAAHNQTENARFFYILPYTASINAMTDRFKEIFPEESVGVLHHRNADYLFRSMETDELSQSAKNETARHMGSLAREMYHPIRVCTPHQILRFALCGRGWETGLSEFPQACFVFDEIHAFEPLLTGLTLATVKLLTSEPFNAKVLFASATLPRFLEEFIKREIGIETVIEPDAENEFDRKVCDQVRHKIEVRDGSLLENLPQIAEEIETSGESALIICNHVATSQAVYRFFNENGFEDLTLLHARFNSRDRNKIEAKITAKKSKGEKETEKKLIESGKRKPAILVATQTVEVSLDIDYDRGYSEPAPADALGQRLGRINRSGSRKDENNLPKPAQVVIFSEPSAGHLYDETLTTSTVEKLRGVGELTEAELTKIVDDVYGNGYPPAAMEDFNRGLKNTDIQYFADEIIAGTHRKWTDEIFEATDAQIEVLPQTLYKDFSSAKKDGCYIEARQLLVPIRWGTYHKAKGMNAIRYDEKLREHIVTLAYDKNEGLNSDKTDDDNFC